MFLSKVTGFCFMFMAVILKGMDFSDQQIYQEEKDQRNAIRQSDQNRQAYPVTEWTVRLAELDARITQFEKERENRHAGSSGHGKMTKEELRAKLKREEEELRARAEEDEARVQKLLTINK